MFEIPPLFNLIREESGLSLREMYQVFNMGHRLECYVPNINVAEEIIKISQSFNIDAKIIGRVESSGLPQILIKSGGEEILFDY